MPMTRRSVCKGLLLTPLAGILPGCSNLLDPTVSVNVYIKNENTTKPCDVFVDTGNVSGSISAGTALSVTVQNVRLPVEVQVQQGSKIISTKNVAESDITGNGARTLAASQLSVLIHENKVNNKIIVGVVFIGEALGAQH